MIAPFPSTLVVILQLHLVVTRTVIFPGMDPKYSTNFKGIRSMPKVCSKMMWTKLSGPILSWKWPTLAGLPHGLLLEPSPGTSADAPRSILDCRRNKKKVSDTYMVKLRSNISMYQNHRRT
jgi:hypothetical protein